MRNIRKISLSQTGQVNSRIEVNPQIVVNPQIQIEHQAQSRQSAPTTSLVKIIVAVIGAIAVILVAFIQKDSSVKTERQSPMLVNPQSEQVNSRLEVNPQIQVNPHIKVVPPMQAATASPRTSSPTYSQTPPIEETYRLIGFTSEDAARLASTLRHYRIASADISLLDAARAGGKNVSIRLLQPNGLTYVDSFGVPTNNVVLAITQSFPENMRRNAQ